MLIFNSLTFDDSFKQTEYTMEYTQTTWKCRFQQRERLPHSRHKPAGLVILVQGFTTKKMVASLFALWELSQKASAALQRL
ncbi:MAG: hypothetical protein DRQ58_04945 [Gammaproteobacteria bacterium]|nr:MAG: hypothetical protein DRQ58_04945 [Gammaproteobacteria bacterium]